MCAMTALSELPSNIAFGFGAHGSALLPPTMEVLTRASGGALSVATFGLCQWERPTAEPAVPLPRLPAPDITLTAGDIQRIRESAPQILGGQTQLPTYFVHAFGEKFLAMVPPSAPIMPQMLGVAGLSDIEIIASALSEWKSKRLPHLSISLCVRWPEPGHYDARAAANVKMLHALRHEQIVDAVYPLDPRSPLARSQGEDAQTQLLARIFAAQLIAHQHDRQNKRFAEVSQSVGTLLDTRGTFAGVATGIARVVAGTRHPLSRLFLRRGLSAEVGSGDVADCLQQATGLATRLLDDEHARTFAAPFNRAMPPYELLFVVPFALRDVRFGRVVQELRAWQTAEVPEAGTPLVVSGSGRLGPDGPNEPDGPDRIARYYCLVACIFGIPDEVVLPQLAPSDRKGSRS